MTHTQSDRYTPSHESTDSSTHPGTVCEFRRRNPTAGWTYCRTYSNGPPTNAPAANPTWHSVEENMRCSYSTQMLSSFPFPPENTPVRCDTVKSNVSFVTDCVDGCRWGGWEENENEENIRAKSWKQQLVVVDKWCWPTTLLLNAGIVLYLNWIELNWIELNWTTYSTAIPFQK